MQPKAKKGGSDMAAVAHGRSGACRPSHLKGKMSKSKEQEEALEDELEEALEEKSSSEEEEEDEESPALNLKRKSTEKSQE